MARDALAAPVELDQLLGHLPNSGAHPRLLAGPLRPTHPVERRRFASGIGRDRVDLLGRKVQPVPAAVLQLQVVAFGAAHRPGHHAGETGDAVHVVDDVVAWSQVVEETLRRARSRPRLTVRSPPPCHVRLGDDRELRTGDEASAVQGRDDDVDARAADPGITNGRWLVEEEATGEALAFEHSRHALRTATTVGTDHDPVAGADELAEATRQAGGVAQHRRPARSLKRDRAGALGNRKQRRDLGGRVRQEAVEAEVEPRHGGRGVARLGPPGRRQALAERHLLVQELGRPVTQPPRLDEHNPAALVEEIGEEVFLRAEPRQP